jgi:hypothetical protein
MIQQITSKKVELPVIFLIEDEADFQQLPKGLPYVIGKQSELPFITLFLEFQVLYRSCMKTLIPIKWLDCLTKIGYGNSLRKYELKSGGVYGAGDNGQYLLNTEDFITDQYLVDFDRLSELKILPVWLEDLKASIETNIIDEVMFDPTGFNKQLGMNIGAAGLKHNLKNLLILDISSSMPKAVVLTITNLAKLMSKKFYADVILTGRRSYLIDYEEVPNTDIVGAVSSYGGGNEGDMYKEIVKQSKEYGTVISFGDNDCPGINKGDKNMNFKVHTLYSLHTEGNRTSNITGYARGFDPVETHIVKDWISTIQ